MQRSRFVSFLRWMLQYSKIQEPEQIWGEQNTKDVCLLSKMSLFGKAPSRGSPLTTIRWGMWVVAEVAAGVKSVEPQT